MMQRVLLLAGPSLCSALLLLIQTTTAFTPIFGGKTRPFATHLGLVPTENPNAVLTKTSVSGIPYGKVLSGLDILYPPVDLAQRNAVSRADGYWPFIKDGGEPPLEFTYGEFDFPFFAELLDRASLYQGGGWAGKTFCDIGSGAGRLVIGAAALHPNLRLCRGVEFLPSCHDLAVQTVGRCAGSKLQPHGMPMAPIELTNGSIGDPTTFIGDVDVAFVMCSTLPEDVRGMVSQAVGTQCRPGSIVIAIDYPIPTEGTTTTTTSGQYQPARRYELELMEKLDGYCWVVGGTSTAYIYRLK